MIIMWAIADMLNLKKTLSSICCATFSCGVGFCSLVTFYRFFFQLNLLLIVIVSVRSSSLSHTGILVQSHFI